MSEHPDVLIVGGGVIGLTCAYFLAREGVRVEVVDKGDFGQEASWAGAGILAPAGTVQPRAPADRLLAYSIGRFPSLSGELRERTGMDNGYIRCGGFEFFSEDHRPATGEWLREGVTFEPVTGVSLQKLEPAVACRYTRAYHFPGMAQVRNPWHVKALVAGCQALGVRWRPDCPVQGFERRGDKITEVRTDRGQLTAGRFLLAAGAWTDTLLEQLGWRPGIRPVRGQIALLNTGTPLFRKIIISGARYLVPRTDGRVLVGSTEEHAGFDKRTTASAIRDLLAMACSLVPALAHAPLERCWAGLRPGSPDGLPFLGPVPGFANLFVAAGHFRSGIQLSPGTAQVMKESLLGQPLTVPLEPFRPDRSGGVSAEGNFR